MIQGHTIPFIFGQGQNLDKVYSLPRFLIHGGNETFKDGKVEHLSQSK